MVGDSIYDFSHTPPRQRKSVHSIADQNDDLKGKYALLSTHYFYFGNKPLAIPAELHGMIMRNQGHRSRSNSMYFDVFLNWLSNQDLKKNHLYGKPQGKLFQNENLDSLFNTECGDLL